MLKAKRSPVLIIDDDLEQLRALSDLFTGAGYQVSTARTGREAMHLLTAPGLEPLLIITDLSMPDMTGWEFITLKHAYLRLSAIPVVVVSGVDLRPDLLPPHAVAKFFRKPIAPTAFLEDVRALVRPERTAASQRAREAETALV